MVVETVNSWCEFTIGFYQIRSNLTVAVRDTEREFIMPALTYPIVEKSRAGYMVLIRQIAKTSIHVRSSAPLRECACMSEITFQLVRYTFHFTFTLWRGLNSAILVYHYNMNSRRTFLKMAGGGAASLVGMDSASRVQGTKRSSPSGNLKEEVIGTFVTFYRVIPDKSQERLAGVWELSEEITDSANTVLEQVPNIVQIADLEDFAEPIAGLLRNISENLAAVYDIQIETKYLDRAVRASGYLPLVAQIWNLLQASLGVQDTADTKTRFIQKAQHRDTGKDAVNRFYIAVLLLFAELVFLGSGVGYRTAFGTTRRVANIGLVRLRSQLGLRAYSVLLSIVHWLVRGTFETTASYIIEKTGEVAQDTSATDYKDFSRLSEKQISEALPKRESSALADIGDYLPFGSQAESTASSIVDSGTERYLIERYRGLGIIEVKDTNQTGTDWFFW